MFWPVLFPHTSIADLSVVDHSANADIGNRVTEQNGSFAQ